jgi:hypothetical protein
MKSKYNGIDHREIKCCCDNPQCIEGGISIEENMLKFHFLEMKQFGFETKITQV